MRTLKIKKNSNFAECIIQLICQFHLLVQYIWTNLKLVIIRSYTLEDSHYFGFLLILWYTFCGVFFFHLKYCNFFHQQPLIFFYKFILHLLKQIKTRCVDTTWMSRPQMSTSIHFSEGLYPLKIKWTTTTCNSFIYTYQQKISSISKGV